MSITLNTAATPTAPRRRSARQSILPATVGVSFIPFLLPLFDINAVAGPTYQAAAVLGLVALLALWWQMMLGVRQITALLHVDRQAAIRLHTWLGIFGSLSVFLHPLIWRVAERQDWSYLWQVEFEFVEARYISLGRIALLLFLVVWLSSTIARYALRYRWWRNLHFLTYPLTALVFVHSFGATGLLDEHPLLNAYWWTLAVTLVVALVYRIVAPHVRPASTLAIHTVLDGVAVVRVDDPHTRRPARPGQFVSVRLRRLGRSHPYSIIQEDTNGALWLAVDGVGRHSRRVARTPDGATVFIDGPHGSFLQETSPTGPRVYIAGGIGITPFLWDLRTRRSQDTTLFHLVRNRSDLALSEGLRRLMGERYKSVVSSETGRLTLADIDPRLLRQATFWVCGSPLFVEQWQSQLRNGGVARRRLHAEQLE